MPSTNTFLTRALDAEDAFEVQRVYDSQPLLMLVLKDPQAPPYANTFKHLLDSGCIAHGTFINNSLNAFVVLWPWADLPASSFVIGCIKADGKIYNPTRTGFQAAMDQALFCLEAKHYHTLYFLRSKEKRWKNSTVTRGLGRLAEYHSRPIEIIESGRKSIFSGLNTRLMGNRPATALSTIVVSTSPYLHDF